MSRYEIVKLMNEEVYYPDWHVKVVKGALTRDEYTGELLAQLKFQNISDRSISQVKLTVIGYDRNMNAVSDEIEHVYSDLYINTYDYFGDNDPIFLYNRTVDKVKIYLDKIVFTDSSYLEYRDNKIVYDSRIHSRIDKNMYEEDYNDRNNFIIEDKSINERREDIQHNTEQYDQHNREQYNVDLKKRKEENRDKRDLENYRYQGYNNLHEDKFEQEKKQKKLIIIIASIIVAVLIILILVFIFELPGSEYEYEDDSEGTQLIYSGPLDYKL